MDVEHLKQIESNDEIRRNLAKWLVHYCFRNSELEHFHDRFSDKEMKALMMDSVNLTYYFLTVLLFSGAGNTNNIIDLLKDRDNLKTKEWNNWDDPVFRDDIHQSSLHLFNVLQERRRSSSVKVEPAKTTSNLQLYSDVARFTTVRNSEGLHPSRVLNWTRTPAFRNFRRISKSWHVSRDRRAVSFVITVPTFPARQSARSLCSSGLSSVIPLTPGSMYISRMFNP
jgi:hypothetical protein